MTGLREHRCAFCRRLLLKGSVRLVEIKCPKCRQLQFIKEDLESQFLTGGKYDESPHLPAARG